MAYGCRILADSSHHLLGDDHRLTTFEITFPRLVLAEFNTHTILSRNSASSRAIPVKKQLRRVLEDPFIPFYWGKNVPGMQAPEPIPEDRIPEARDNWLRGRNRAMLTTLCELIGYEQLNSLCRWAAAADQHYITRLALPDQQRILEKVLDQAIDFFEDESNEDLILNVHKQLCNRLLEPFMWHTVITTGTEWRNFFALRCHNDAQPEIRVVAEMMRDVYGLELPGDQHSEKLRYEPYREWAEAGYSLSEPVKLAEGEWHTPLLTREQMERYGIDWDVARDVSVGRCARVSYLTHDNREDWEADVTLAQRLRGSGHMSPYQHVGRPMLISEARPKSYLYEEDGDVQICWDGEYDVWSGNFRGFVQYRKLLPNEFDFSEVRALGQV